MELPRKFEFFPIFHFKTILFSSEFEFSMKNVFFWSTLCESSSKIKKVEGGLISCNCSLWLPLPISLFFELHQHDVPQKNTFFIENLDSEEKSIVLKWKIGKNWNFLGSPISHSCVMYYLLFWPARGKGKNCSPTKNFGIFEISSSKILWKCIIQNKFLKRRNRVTLL